MGTHIIESLVLAHNGARRSREWVRQVINLLDAAVRQLHPDEQAIQGAILEATSLLRKQIEPAADQGPADGKGRLLAWQARKVCDFIEAQITGPISVADLCVLVHRSQAHFSRSFKLTFGESPHAFVVRRRVELAAQCMLQTDASLSDIAQRFGFTDQAHLCKHFRQAMGQTPAAWRRTQKLQDDAAVLRPAPQPARARPRLTQSPAFSPEPLLRIGS